MPSRDIVQADAFAWMDAHPAPARASVITSLPDVSELSHLDVEAWKAWFVGAVRRVIRWVPEDGVAVFYQSDIRHDGAWIDKGYLVVRGAEEEGAHLVWHTIVCRRPPGTIALGRPSYSHMIAVRRGPRLAVRSPGPDVLPDAGHMPWSKAMGVEACRVACRFVRDDVGSQVIVDPFCGRGTVLAVANAMGLDAIGVDVGAKRCRAARALVLGGEEEEGERLFDEGAWWEAHEAWERRWRAASDPAERRTLQGLIQIAAALHKLLVLGEPASAARLFARGIAKLEARPDLQHAFAACAQAAEQGRFERAALPRLGGP
jgi:hypothetical protein